MNKGVTKGGRNWVKLWTSDEAQSERHFYTIIVGVRLSKSLCGMLSLAPLLKDNSEKPKCTECETLLIVDSLDTIQ